MRGKVQGFPPCLPCSRQELIFSQPPKPYFYVLVWGTPTSKTDSLGTLPNSCMLGFPYLKASLLLESPSSHFVFPQQQQEIVASCVSSMEIPTILEHVTLDKHEIHWDVFIPVPCLTDRWQDYSLQQTLQCNPPPCHPQPFLENTADQHHCGTQGTNLPQRSPRLCFPCWEPERKSFIIPCSSLVQVLRNCWVWPYLSLDVVQFCFLIPYICILYSPFLMLFTFASQFIALLKQDDASLNFPLKRSAEEWNHSKPKKLPQKIVPTENGQQEFFFKVINLMRQGIIFSVGKTPCSWYRNKILNHLRAFLLSFAQKLGQ